MVSNERRLPLPPEVKGLMLVIETEVVLPAQQQNGWALFNRECRVWRVQDSIGLSILLSFVRGNSQRTSSLALHHCDVGGLLGNAKTRHRHVGQRRDE